MGRRTSQKILRSGSPLKIYGFGPAPARSRRSQRLCYYGGALTCRRIMKNKPYEFIGFGDIHGLKPYEFIGFGDIHAPNL